MKRSTSKASPKKTTVKKPSPALAAAHFDFELVKQFTDFMKENDLMELDLRSGEKEIRLRRSDLSKATLNQFSNGFAPQSSVSIPSPVVSTPIAEPKTQKSHHIVTSPFVGTFYRSPGTNQDPFVEEGKTVTAGETLCIVEAMKLMNEIESDIKGRVLRILVSNGTPVEFGEGLFEIEAL